MGIREQAEKDLENILSDPDGPATPFTLITPNGKELELKGIYGDIGHLLDIETGLPVQGRKTSVTCLKKAIMEKTALAPGQGWKAKIRGLDGMEYIFHVVKFEPDLTVNLGRINLAVSHGKSVK